MNQITDLQKDDINSYPESNEFSSIQYWIDQFYILNKNFNGNKDDFKQMRNIHNNIKNKMESYLKTFRNNRIMTDYHNQLKDAKKKAINNGKINKYKQYINEIRVVQEFKGIEDNIVDKLRKEFRENMKKWRESHVKQNDN